MKKIKFRSDWHSYDMLDGEKLQKGQWLKIQWPNGTSSKELVDTEVTEHVVQDMWNPYTCSTTRAFIKPKYKGHVIKVHICGLKAESIQ